MMGAEAPRRGRIIIRNQGDVLCDQVDMFTYVLPFDGPADQLIRDAVEGRDRETSVMFLSDDGLVRVELTDVFPVRVKYEPSCAHATVTFAFIRQPQAV
jgi:hypothetical protein